MNSTPARWRALQPVGLLALGGAAMFVSPALAAAPPTPISILIVPFRTLDSPSNDHCHLDKSGWIQLQTAMDEAADNFGDMIVKYPEREGLNDVLSEEATIHTLDRADARNLTAARTSAATYMIMTDYVSIPNSHQCRADARLVEVKSKAGIANRWDVFRDDDVNPLGSLGMELVMGLRKKLGMWVPNNTFRLIVECFSITGAGSESVQTIRGLARGTTITSLSGWELRNLKIIPREDSYCEGKLSVNSQSGGTGDKDVELSLRGKIMTYSSGKSIRVHIDIEISDNNGWIRGGETDDEMNMSEMGGIVSKLVAGMKKQVAFRTFMQTEGRGNP